MALGRSESGGLGFSVTAGGQGGQLAVVRRVWDRRHCHSLQPGDAIVKINGADVQSLNFSQVKTYTHHENLNTPLQNVPLHMEQKDANQHLKVQEMKHKETEGK